MAATVKIIEYNGAGPSETDITAGTSKMGTEDANICAANRNLVKPAAGTNYGYKKTYALKVTVTPVGTVNNVKWWPTWADAWAAGATLGVKTNSGAYAQATGTPGDTGTELSGVTDATTYDVNSKLAVTGTMTNPDTGKLTHYLEMQAAIASTYATQGPLPVVTSNWQFDET